MQPVFWIGLLQTQICNTVRPHWEPSLLVGYIGSEDLKAYTWQQLQKVPSWSQNVNAARVLHLLCPGSPLSNLTSPNQEEVLERNTANMTWLRTIQRDMTGGDEENTYGFLTTPPPSLPHILMHTSIPALAVPDRKTKGIYEAASINSINGPPEMLSAYRLTCTHCLYIPLTSPLHF